MEYTQRFVILKINFQNNKKPKDKEGMEGMGKRVSGYLKEESSAEWREGS